MLCFRKSTYQIIEERERPSDDSGMDLPYSRVSINLLGDPDIQNALNKSASAEDLVSPQRFSLVCLVIVAHGSLLYAPHITRFILAHVCCRSVPAACYVHFHSIYFHCAGLKLGFGFVFRKDFIHSFKL